MDTFNEEDIKRFGFLIEDDDALAERLRAKHVKPKSISHDSLDPEAATLAAVFEYFIGNLDFSLTDNHGDESCCHNVKLMLLEDGRHLPVPYDFDMSGMVDAPYAMPPVALTKAYDLRSVRNRLYRGFCSPPELLTKTLSKFRERREEIYALVHTQELLKEKERRYLRRFIEDFYKDIEGERSIERNFVDRMRGC
ncbi:MAG: hypothetical protein HUJ31_18920 [Pseudomonadales bacterium]|nr:hypothetical protein [Pseudomonadales bacterium]